MDTQYMNSNRRYGIQKGARYFIKVHRRLIKPPYPVKIFCPACGHSLIKVNSDLIEISNSFGLKEEELTATDCWSEQKHTCGAKVALYWKA